MVTIAGSAVAVPAPTVRSRVAVVLAEPMVIETTGAPPPPAPGSKAIVPPLLVLVAVADVVVADADPVEVPAVSVATPVVWATANPAIVSRSPSVMGVGAGGSDAKTP